MKKTLNDFWKWLGKSFEEYAEKGLDYFDCFGHMEIDFPDFECLKEQAFEIVDKNITSQDELYDLLTVMAIDNQNHTVMNYIAKHSSDEQLKKIIEVGVLHLQPETRLQLPALIYRRKPHNYREGLSNLLKDSDIRVKRRSNTALNFLDKNLSDLTKIEDFWRWLGISSESYANKGIRQIDGREECDFPFFEELLDYAKSIIDFDVVSDKEINDLFVVMSIDNESENILDYIESNSSEEQIAKLISLGINHIQYQGRWQLAELIYRRKPKNYENFLSILSADSNSVVSSRAKNLLTLLK